MHFEQSIWWYKIDEFMRSLVDGYDFDKGAHLTSFRTLAEMEADAERRQITFEDLFFWAIVSGQPRMVELVWARVRHPLRCAAVGVDMCRRIRRKYFSRGRGKIAAKNLLESILHLLEQGIVGVLDNISRPKVGRYILIQRQSALGCKAGTGTCSLLDLGVRFRLRGLVAHELSHGVLENQWVMRPQTHALHTQHQALSPRQGTSVAMYPNL